QEVWTLVDLTNGKRAIGTKWVFKNKKDERGIVIRNKARLVAQGYTQEKGISYNEVFAHVARIEAIRLFLSYASFKDFVVYQMDVNNDFLYGKIEEEVYACQPPGFEDSNFPNIVYKVIKALYGLHQALRVWYEILSTYLLDNGFQIGKIDKTLFIKMHKGDILLVQVYMDDIIFGLTKKELCNAFERLMHEKFQMSSIGELTFFLGLQVKQKKDGIFISHDKYVGEILKKFRFTKFKTASTPMETQKPLLKDKDGVEVDVHMYRVDGKKVIISEASIRRDLQFADEEGVDCLPNSIIFEQFSLIGKPTRKVTKVPQPSDPIEHVKDEAIHKELRDILVRAATTASSLEAEQDGGNTDKTESKATPNESSSQGTDSGGGPRCQEAIGDTIAQTRFENVSKQFNDSLLARGNTLQSDKNRLKHNELMELCTNLQTRVLDLEKKKTIQANVIDSIKRRVKKLEKRNRSRNHKLKRLYEVGLTAKVESLDNEESLANAEMFDVDKDFGGKKVFVEQEVVADKEKIKEVTLAPELAKLKTLKPKAKGVVIQEPSESPITTTTIPKQKSQDTGKGILVEDPLKPKKKDQIRLDEEFALKLQAVFDEEQRLTREKAEEELEANISLIET
nr:putative ribonuclease H-like domain-containing protein [Tanacetum cinerariifolium]